MQLKLVCHAGMSTFVSSSESEFVGFSRKFEAIPIVRTSLIASSNAFPGAERDDDNGSLSSSSRSTTVISGGECRPNAYSWISILESCSGDLTLSQMRRGDTLYFVVLSSFQ